MTDNEKMQLMELAQQTVAETFAQVSPNSWTHKNESENLGSELGKGIVAAFEALKASYEKS